MDLESKLYLERANNEMRMKYVIVLLFSLFLMLSVSLTSAMNASSSSYSAYIDFGSGAELTSSTYGVQVALNDLVGSLSSASYNMSAGFIPTTIIPVVATANATTTTTTTTTTGGGGGGGGGAATPPEPREISVSPEDINLMVTSGGSETRELTVKNLKSNSVYLTIDVGGELSGIVKIQDSLLLIGGEEKKITFKVENAEKGLLTGRIIFRAGAYSKEVRIVVNVKSENFLFDSAIMVPEEFKVISSGESLTAQVSLLQVGPQEKVDVTANYVIKDFSGKEYLKESETFFVLGSKDYTRKFSSSGIPPGKYIIGMDILYPGAFATSSAQFEIVGLIGGFSTKMIILILLAGIVAVGFIIWALKSRRKLYKGLRRKP